MRLAHFPAVSLFLPYVAGVFLTLSSACQTVQTAQTAQSVPIASVKAIVLPESTQAGQPITLHKLVQTPILKVNAIALYQGTSLPTHQAPVPVTIQAIQGSGTITLTPAGEAAQTLPLDPYHMVMLAADVPHAITPNAGVDMIVLVHYLNP